MLGTSRTPVKGSTSKEVPHQWWGQEGAIKPTATTVLDLFLQHASHNPDAPAVWFEHQSWSYLELSKATASLAKQLQQQGISKGDCVALLLPRTPVLLPAMLGCWFVGAHYVAIDAEFPKTRISDTLHDANPKAVLTTSTLQHKAESWEGHSIDISELAKLHWSELPHPPQSLVPVERDSGELAYLIYTSGSTGKPKGATVPHRGLVNLVTALPHVMDWSHDTVGLMLSSVSFDMSVLEIYQPLAVGGCLAIVPTEIVSSGFALAQMLHSADASAMIATPTTLRMLLEADWSPSASFAILSGGEPLQRSTLEALLSRGCKVWNGYGISETTICTTVAPLPTPETPITLGQPLANTRVYVLDPNQQHTVVGEDGEIYIGGAGVGPESGYLHQPELTELTFLPDPWSPQPHAKMYRTGDRGYWDQEGNLVFLGRKDEQVKVRGVRVELGEVENRLSQHPDVKAVAVSAWEEAPGETTLVAYVVPQNGATSTETIRDVRQFMCAQLPQAMQPTRYVTLEELPRSTAGKVDRKSLPSLASRRPEEMGPYVAPASENETIIAACFEEVLTIRPVGRHDEFLWLGGDSLHATRLVARLKAKLQVPLTVQDVFEEATPERLALKVERLQAEGAWTYSEPERQPRNKPLPLSPSQRRIWFIHQLQPDSVEYNTPAIVEMNGPLDLARLKTALGSLVKNHESLRLRFRAGKDGLPVQEAAPHSSFPLAHINVSSLEEEQANQQADRFAHEFFRRPFDLANEPPFRVQVIQLSETKHHLLIILHHIISDIWTINVLFQELVTLLDGTATKEAESLQVPDLAVWQCQQEQHGAWDSQLQDWKERLASSPTSIALPTTRPRPSKRKVAGDVIQLSVPATLTERLKKVAQKSNATLFMPLLTTVATWLATETGQWDLPIGTMLANRTHPAMEKALGFFANTLVLRLQSSPDTTLHDLLCHTRDVALKAYSQPDVPFEKLVQHLSPQRTADQQPLFQVCVLLQEAPPPTQHVDTLELTLKHTSNGTAPFDLTFQFWETPEGLQGEAWYRTDIFTQADMQRLATRWNVLVEQLVSDSSIALKELRPSYQLSWEQELLSHPDVLDAAVLPKPHSDGHTELVGYVVSKNELPTEFLHSIEAGRHQTPGSLPLHQLVRVAQIPLTEAGHPDHRKLSNVPLLGTDSLSLATAALQETYGLEGVVEAWNPPPALYAPIAQGTAPTQTEATQEANNRTKPEGASDASQPLSLMEGPELVFPKDMPSTLLEALQRTADQHPSNGIRTLHNDGTSTVLTYAEFQTWAQRVATKLLEHHFPAGQPVLLQLPSPDQFLAGLWGCMFAGLPPVSMGTPPLYEGEHNQIAKLLNVWKLLDAPPILTIRSQEKGLQRLAQQHGLGAFDLVFLDEPLPSPELSQLPSVNNDDISLFLLTSGSTGKPKAVRHHHHTVLAWAESYRQQNHFHGGDTFLNWLPIDHVGGLFMSHMAPLFAGSKQIHGSSAPFLKQPLQWLEWLETWEVTCSWAPNFAFGLVNGEEEALKQRTYDLSRLRYLLNGGEMIVPQTAKTFLSLMAQHGLPHDAMTPSWGMSEIASASTLNMGLRHETIASNAQFVSVGKPAPGYTLRIVNEKGELVPQGTPGHLHIQSPTVMSGYHKQPEQSAQVLLKDGWFNTGDLATLTSEGLTITGRSKADIVVNGLNIPSHDIETAVEELPQIQRSFVVACAVRKENDNTDQIAIFFAHKATNDAELQELLKSMRGAVSRKVGAVPRYFLPLPPERIPKTNIGKLQRKKLKKDFDAGVFEMEHLHAAQLLSEESPVVSGVVERIWRPRPLPSVAFASLPKTVVLFAQSPKQGEQLRNLWLKKGIETWFVTPGDSFSQSGHHISLPHNRSSYCKLWDTLASKIETPPTIVHLWTYQELATTTPTSSELLGQQQQSVHSLLWLLQSVEEVLGEQAKSLSLLVASQHAQNVLGKETLNPAWSPMLGWLATIPHEAPCVRLRHLDLPKMGPDGLSQTLLDERLCLSQVEHEVSYRNGQRWVPRLRSAFLPQAPHLLLHRQASASFATQPGELLLLTGGMGGLGQWLAKHLLQEKPLHLLLVGRAPQNQWTPQKQQAWKTLQEICHTWPDGDASVSYEALNLAETSCLDWLQEQESFHKARLRGVFHLAGAMREEMLQRETSEQVEQLFQGRVLGANQLTSFLAERPGAFAIDFASVSAIFGGLGAGAYAAIGRFSQAWTHNLNQQGNPALSLYWSRWDNIGMAYNFPGGELLRRHGFRTISQEEGWKALQACLTRGVTQAILGLDNSHPVIRRKSENADLRLERLKLQPTRVQPPASLHLQDAFGTPIPLTWKVDPTTPAAPSEARPKPSKPSSPHTPPTEMERTVEAIWKDLLELPKIRRDDNFFELGGHSLLLAQAQQRLEQTLGQSIPLVELFRHSTLRTLAQHLSSQAVPLQESKPNSPSTRARQQRNHLARMKDKRRKKT
ncbi:MAG: amino acid adenylation domain-containing protein [Deltaproteobacteria bacterium]|nr:MAG: amino acid adenylation domain-containing protein [Deltaproteobacteria bacterium]